MKCNTCGSGNVYGMSRVVGYYSIIENWNGAKQSEFSDRQKGDYGVEEEAVSRFGKTDEQEVIMVH